MSFRAQTMVTQPWLLIGGNGSMIITLKHSRMAQRIIDRYYLASVYDLYVPYTYSHIWYAYKGHSTCLLPAALPRLHSNPGLLQDQQLHRQGQGLDVRWCVWCSYFWRSWGGMSFKMNLWKKKYKPMKHHVIPKHENFIKFLNVIQID